MQSLVVMKCSIILISTKFQIYMLQFLFAKLISNSLHNVIVIISDDIFIILRELWVRLCVLNAPKGLHETPISVNGRREVTRPRIYIHFDRVYMKLLVSVMLLNALHFDIAISLSPFNSNIYVIIYGIFQEERAQF